MVGLGPDFRLDDDKGKSCDEGDGKFRNDSWVGFSLYCYRQQGVETEHSFNEAKAPKND